MAVVHQASDLPQSQLALEQPHFLVGQDIGDSPSVATGSAGLETLVRDVGIAPLTISQQVEADGQYLLEEFGTVAAAIKDHRDASLAHQSTQLGENAGQRLDQAGVGFGGDHEQRVAGTIVDPDRKSTRLNSSHLVISYAVF